MKRTEKDLDKTREKAGKYSTLIGLQKWTCDAWEGRLRSSGKEATDNEELKRNWKTESAKYKKIKVIRFH